MHHFSHTSAFLRCLKQTALSLAVASAFAPTAFANPVGPTVVSGSATFNAAGNVLNVTNAPGTIINWQQFNIGQNEITKFIQQNASSTVLNRIGGQDPSQILGTLQSNGRVFLVNPNGILFGHNAVIDVAGLVASSLNLGNADFLAGRFSFAGGGAGAVVNQGAITTPVGGSVYLVGSDVRNEGLITSPQGAVLLAAGNSVSLADTGTPAMSVTLTAAGNHAINLGRIDADGGHIDIYGALIDQQGVLRADSASVDARGQVVLKATQSVSVSGEISATGAGQGGIVQVLGNSVTLTGTAKVDVSGAAGGGVALIGGDYQGKNAAVQNATTTTIAAGATIKADALDAGNGGKVVVWSDDKTFYDGFIAARGGANGGDGGFVETSGHTALSVRGRVDTTAANGKTGMWLLDPTSYCVEQNAGGCSGAGFAATTTYLASDLESFLASSNVQLTAGDYFAYMPNGGTYTYTIPAGRSIELSAPYIYVNGTFQTTQPLWMRMLATSGTSSTWGYSRLVEFDSGAHFTSGGGGFHAEANTVNVASGASVNVGNGSIKVVAGTIQSMGGNSFTSHEMEIETNSLIGPLSINSSYLRVVPRLYYTGGTRDVHLGLMSADPRCATALCIYNQLQGSVLDGMEIAASNDLYVQGAFGNPASRLVLVADHGSLYLNSPISVAGLPSKPVAAIFGAKTRFVNNAGASAIVTGQGRWVVIAPDASAIEAGGLVAASQLGMADVFNTDYATENAFWDALMAALNPAAANGNVFGYFNSTATQQVVNQQLAQQSEAITTVTTTDASAPIAGITTPTAQITYGDQPLATTGTASPTLVTASVVAVKTQERRELRAAETAAEARKSEAELKAEASQARAESRKAETEAKKSETEAKKAETEAKKAETEAKKAGAEAKTAAKKTEAVTKKAEAEAKKEEAESKKAEAESKKAEAESKEAAAEAKSARGEKKTELTEKAQEKQVESVQKKAEADVKKVKAEEKKLEAEAHKAEGAGRKAEAQAKRAEAEKRAEARKAEAVKAFTARIVGEAGDRGRAMLAAMRHEYKTEIFQPALKILEANSKAADLPDCGAGASDVCIPTQTQVRQEVQQQAAAARPAAPSAPTVFFLPQIQRKVAVMLGINDYADKAIPALESAVPDAEAVGNLLKGQLGYEVRVIKNATKADIVKSLGNLSKELGPQDSVTIYYAGHGYQMKDSGYWIPADASVKDPANWVSNSDVSKLMGNIQAKQVMLVSDSCYSGAFTKEQKVGDVAADAQAILNRRSVVVMSSGGEEPVSDEGRDGHSIFAWNLMNSLKGVDKFETGSKLFGSIKKGVIDEFPQVPQYGAATSAGHTAGGDYLFEVRSYR